MFRRISSVLSQKWYTHDFLKMIAAAGVAHLSLSTMLKHNTMVNQKRSS